jgi:hypothetical protein
MQCEEFENRLNAVLDERARLEWDHELRLHSESCSRCRQLADAYDALLDGFYALSAPNAPADMSLRVLAEMRPQVASQWRLPVVAAALATAAALLVTVTPLLRGPAQPAKSVDDATAIHSVAARTPADQRPLEQLPLMSDLLSIAASPDGDPYAGLAKETGQGLANVVLYVPGIGYGRGIIDIESRGQSEEPAWAVQMSEGLKPLSDSVTQTFNLLMRSLPVSQLASRS